MRESTRRADIDDAPAADYQLLEIAAGRALVAGDFIEAFACADRRCRIPPPPEAHGFVLRAEASYRLGDRQGAIADLVRALEIAPNDPNANRRVLAWTNGSRRDRAAEVLIATERDPRTIADAIAVLRDSGRNGFAAVTIHDDLVTGWAAWPGRGPVTLSIAGADRTETATIEADPFHPLTTRSLGAASFRLRRPASHEAQSVTLAADGESFHVAHAEPNEWRRGRRRTVGEDGTAVTVIVPVYGDFQATRTCLDIVSHEVARSPDHHLLVVNDATPDARIARYLDRLADRPGVSVIENTRNAGFVDSVNRALESVSSGDVILLNADTVPPRDFIRRLARAAHAEPGIGAVVPLSNNAEVTSFPLPYVANPLPSPPELTTLDAIAAAVNRGRRIDIPSGTGFCLYLTSDCLEAVGFLSRRYYRGYLEDVDLCLRAREHGFRVVCDPSIYVGHAGTRSFGGEKASLVLRNLAELARRFPDYVRDASEFSRTDPLRKARSAIEARAIEAKKGTRLIVTGEGALAAVARDRAARVTDDRAVIAEFGSVTRADKTRLFAADGGIPQSIECDLASPAGRKAFAAIVESLGVASAEIVDPAQVPDAFLDILPRLPFPYDLVVADDGLMPPVDRLSAAAGRRRSALIAGARRILAPCAQAEAFAAAFLDAKDATRLVLAGAPMSPRYGKARPHGALGIVAVRKSPAELRFIRETARALRRSSPETRIVVLGETLDDDGLIRIGNLHVTGALAPDELPRLIRLYRLGSLVAGIGAPLFGHPMILAVTNSDLPTAWLDWSGGNYRPAPGDLLIDPGAPADDAAAALAAWIGGAAPKRAASEHARPARRRDRTDAPRTAVAGKRQR